MKYVAKYEMPATVDNTTKITCSVFVNYTFYSKTLNVVKPGTTKSKDRPHANTYDGARCR